LIDVTIDVAIDGGAAPAVLRFRVIVITFSISGNKVNPLSE
jgi:hypothetical protein